MGGRTRRKNERGGPFRRKTQGRQNSKRQYFRGGGCNGKILDRHYIYGKQITTNSTGLIPLEKERGERTWDKSNKHLCGGKVTRVNRDHYRFFKKTKKRRGKQKPSGQISKKGVGRRWQVGRLREMTNCNRLEKACSSTSNHAS